MYGHFGKIIEELSKTGIGVILDVLNQQKQSNPSQKSNRDVTPLPSTAQPIAQKYILILVVNADRNIELVEILKTQSQVTSAIWEDVYTATEALWIGGKEKFENTGLSDNFASAETLQPSEYDVYFVKIELPKYEYDLGFAENADSLDRSDAFERILETEHHVIVSHRLSNQSTKNPLLYR
ncbi:MULTISPECIES: hypothetical protein [Spirulina sp. CCY15215]|uniref:hypothetical protein n=1 Tax=Spirulina sp. CCY15215 TaxID=2767591 RepID=UPI00194F11BA|nr:hypothetical protein [Spirulina major]